jgi:hypothetical protein
MIYQIRVNKAVKNVKVYVITKKLGQKETWLTKMFIKIFNQQGKKADQQTAQERLG